ncbi:hypothetical protein GWG65_13270 [Bradyrhizobium sp. CSA207]|uniref:hypothetical protein n=1 Tax=Bradyrhizobium sp. CSA207 TaxID=2698826 RepID=UPI0023B0E094|nr:hypothetical protein [Bradyrhizobium sp. CSA207]MDE5442400.1 hypothetical protein [Bradyrhizobium sp. CSA207]
MLLGDTSATMVWMLFLGAFVLGGAILYGMSRSGHLRRSERAQLDRNTETAQDLDDPQRRTGAADRQVAQGSSRAPANSAIAWSAGAALAIAVILVIAVYNGRDVGQQTTTSSPNSASNVTTGSAAPGNSSK